MIAAFVNAVSLIGLSVWVFWEGYQRLKAPQPIAEGAMIAVAAVGILMNGAIMLGLNASRHNDLNIRSTFVHMLGDLLGCFAIVVGGVVIHYTGLLQIDTVLSLVIAALIVWSAWDIVKESLNILLEGLPRGIELSAVTSEMRKVDGVLDVHDLHIWSLGSNSRALSCHVLIQDVPPSESDGVLRRINHVLGDHFHIHHTTIQFEHEGCHVSLKGCVIPVDAGHSHAGHHHH